MKKNKSYIITISVHPAVRRFFENRYPKVNGAYNITNSRHYYLVTNMLMHSTVGIPSIVSKKYGAFVQIRILITEYDFYHYGWSTTNLQQYRFSKLIIDEILEIACQRIAILKITLGIPRRKCMMAVLDEELFEQDEISYEYLSKYYQRKFKHNEKKMITFINDLKSEDEDL